MPRDYKNRTRVNRAPKRREPGVPRWGHALAGLTLGLCVAVGAYVEGRYPGTFLATTEELIPVPSFDVDTAAELAEERSTAKKPRFEFYSLLPQMEVNVSTEKTTPRQPPQIKRPTPTRVTEQPAQRLPSAERARRLLAGEDSSKINAAQFGQIKPMAPAASRPAAKPETRAGVAALARNDKYMVQLGSFRVLSDADRMKANLALTGHRVVIRTAVLSDSSKRHRVQIGPFRSLEDARRASSGVSRGQPLFVKVQS
jgi:cell division protein FtsN